MNELQRLIQLAKADGGKFFVIDEKGEPALVIMPIDEYEKVLLHKVKNQIEDIEEVNRKIIDAQKQEQDRQSFQDDLKSEVIDSTFDFEAPISASANGLETDAGIMPNGVQPQPWDEI